MADKNQLFTVSAITRAGIAENLNEFLEDNEILTNDEDGWFADDDDRLTDEICTEYAKLIGEVDEDGFSDTWIDEQMVKIDEDTIRKCGINTDV